MYSPGLEGIVVKESKICLIDTESSKIYYRGYDLEELAERSTFEETVYCSGTALCLGDLSLKNSKELSQNTACPPATS